MTEGTVCTGDLFFLLHPGEIQFSGYGLVVADGIPNHLVGLLMVDRPQAADEAWLRKLQDAFGRVELYPITQSGERGLACHMFIDEASLVHVRRLRGAFREDLQNALAILLLVPPAPQLDVSWDEESRLWVSQFHEPETRGKRRLPLFSLGDVVATPGALEALDAAGQIPQEFLHRHVTGDWGELVEEDREANERAVYGGQRIFSSYRTKAGERLWVITEYDRSVTTLLLPAEY